MVSDEKIREIISNLTLEEKASLCSGEDCWHTKEIKRLGIPSVFFSDGPHGLRKQIDTQDNLGIGANKPATCFPTASLTACSFDDKLIEEMGVALGKECSYEGVDVLLGPGINMKRSPLCGRNFEYFSEDPYLSARMGAAWIRGVQSQGVGASLKHFAANNQEKRRMNIDARLDKRTLYETYLRAFNKVLEETKPYSVMCSYNKINGTYASENTTLLSDILRKEWEYEGLVVSDWGAVHNRAEGIVAGLDLEMPGCGGINDKKICQAVTNGSLNIEDLNKACENIIRLAFKCQDKKIVENIDKKEHHGLAVRVARESMVLLKNNNNALPLSLNKTVGVIGEFALNPRFQGAGSSKITPNSVNIPLNELKALGIDAKYYQVSEAMKKNIEEDTVVVFAGLPEGLESEGVDRDNMDLPKWQGELIEKLHGDNKKIIVVLMLGAPVELSWENMVDSILLAYLGGEGVGTAIAQILSGEVSPSGRLAESWPLALESNPSYENFPGDCKNVYYQEGIYTGYRYYYSKNIPVLYPFGHGLSYVEFEYSDFSINKDKISYGEKFEVEFKVTNLCEKRARHSILLFYSHESNNVELPKVQLAGFVKVELGSKESKMVKVTLDTRDLAYYDIGYNSFMVESGVYRLYLGNPMCEDENVLTKDIEIISDREVLNGKFEPVYKDNEIKSIQRPFNWDNCLLDCKDTKTGRMILWFAKRIIKFVSRKERNQEQMMVAAVTEMPFFALYTSAAGTVGENVFEGLITILNGHLIKGLGQIIKKKK